MAYGKRQLQPPAFPAAPAPTADVAAHQTAVERDAVRDFFTTTDEVHRAKMTIATSLLVLATVLALHELASEPGTAWIGIPGLLLTLAVGGLAARRALRDRRHLGRSTTAPGTVTGAVQVGKLNPSVRPTFRFTSLDGVEHRATAAFPERALGEGRTLTVRYDITDPSWVVVDGDEFHRSRNMVRLLAALVVPAAFALIAAIVQLVAA